MSTELLCLKMKISLFEARKRWMEKGCSSANSLLIRWEFMMIKTRGQSKAFFLYHLTSRMRMVVIFRSCMEVFPMHGVPERRYLD
ncbi:MAG: hypothetical protein CBD65_01785 [Synechococcus sp. TMED205]|nr:MAG: hypothetical protein CBD65_01785 [Synechococcus sp. TMED205]HCX54703.1 hypothetical protein [Synechococcus sp. UBA9887]